MVQASIQGVTSSLTELIQTRPAKNATGFVASGKVSTHQWGGSQSLYHGRGMTYAESRLYQHGDDVKNMDWRVTARTGKAYTKLYQEERERPVFILVDLRPQMFFGTRVRFKSHMAVEIAATLAWLGHDAGDRIGGQIITAQGVENLKPTRTRRGVLHFLASLTNNMQPQTSYNQPNQSSLASPANSANLDKPPKLSASIQQLTKFCHSGSLVFVISDFSTGFGNAVNGNVVNRRGVNAEANTLTDVNPSLAQSLTSLSAHVHTTLIQVTDPLEHYLPANGGRLSDGQAVIDMHQLGKQALQRHAQGFSNRQQQLQKFCAKKHMQFHHVQTDQAVSDIFLPKQRGKQP